MSLLVNKFEFTMSKIIYTNSLIGRSSNMLLILYENYAESGLGFLLGQEATW